MDQERKTHRRELEQRELEIKDLQTLMSEYKSENDRMKGEAASTRDEIRAVKGICERLSLERMQIYEEKHLEVENLRVEQDREKC
jgi:hypothetical protein